MDKGALVIEVLRLKAHNREMSRSHTQKCAKKGPGSSLVHVRTALGMGFKYGASWQWTRASDVMGTLLLDARLLAV